MSNIILNQKSTALHSSLERFLKMNMALTKLNGGGNLIQTKFSFGLILLIFSFLTGCAPMQFDIGEKLNTNLWRNELEYEGALGNGLTVYRVKPKFTESFSSPGYLLDSNSIIVKSLNESEINNYKNLILQEFKQRNIRNEELRKAEENRRIELIRKEEERIAVEKAIRKKSNDLIKSNGFVVVYEKDNFYVVKNKTGSYAYIKDGTIRNKKDVMEEISEYEAKRWMLIQEEKIRIANLAKTWQIVVSGNGNCRITRVGQGVRDFDGSVKFDFAYSCWNGRSGGVSAGSLSCGVNQANYVNSNHYSAKCF